MDSSDSQIDLLRGAPNDLDHLIEASAEVCTAKPDKLRGLEAQALYLQGAQERQNYQEEPKSGGDQNGLLRCVNAYNQNKRPWDQRQPRQHLTYNMQAKAKQYSYSYQKKFGPGNQGGQGNPVKNQNGKAQFMRPFTGKAGTKCQFGASFTGQSLINNGSGSSTGNPSQLGQSSNFEWRCASAVKNVSFDPHQKRVFIAEADEGKITTLDLQVYPDSSSFKFRDQLRIQKYKTLLKGIEDSRLISALPMKDYVALELVQPNCQTYLVFTDRQTGTFKGAFHYQREIKSGSIFLNNEGPEEYDPSRDETIAKSAPASSTCRETHLTDLASLTEHPDCGLEPIEQTLNSQRVSLNNDRHSNQAFICSPVKNTLNPAQNDDADLNQSDLSRSCVGLKVIRLSEKHAEEDTPMTDSEPIVQHSQSSKQSPTTGTTSVGEAETQSKDKTTHPFYCASSNADQDMQEPTPTENVDSTPSILSGIIAVIEHGVQQFIMHLNPWTMASIAFPLNRNEYNNQSSTFSRKSGELIQPEQLKLVDLGSTSMFGVLQDNRHFQVKQFIKKRSDQGEHLELLHISQIDFGSLAQSIQNFQGFQKPKTEPIQPVLSQLVPLNRTDSILVNLASSKRYLVYNYVIGQITKEILPLRGSSFKICSDWMFDLEKTPYITMYNANSIRRVDINTFEIKKNINLNRLAKTDAEFAKFPLISQTAKSNYQWTNQKANQPFKYPYPNQNQYVKKNPYPVKYQKINSTRKPYDANEHDIEIQEVILMPMMKLEPVPQTQAKVDEQQAPKTKTKFILHQLGQITIAIPQVVSDTSEPEPQQEEKSMYEKGYEQDKQKAIDEAIQTVTLKNPEPQEPYVPLQMNKEQRALFSAGMPVAAVHGLQQSSVQQEAKQAKHDAAQPAFVNSILDNGQRLLVIVGKERRLIKLL